MKWHGLLLAGKSRFVMYVRYTLMGKTPDTTFSYWVDVFKGHPSLGRTRFYLHKPPWNQVVFFILIYARIYATTKKEQKLFWGDLIYARIYATTKTEQKDEYFMVIYAGYTSRYLR